MYELVTIIIREYVAPSGEFQFEVFDDKVLKIDMYWTVYKTKPEKLYKIFIKQ